MNNDWNYSEIMANNLSGYTSHYYSIKKPFCNK